MPADSTATERFLRLCLLGQWQPEARQSAAALLPILDWPALLAESKDVRLRPLLYHLLRAEPLVPAGARQALRTAYDYSARYNLYLFGELRRVLAAFRQADVPVLVLKGGALIPLVYGNPALRPLRDLDLLVPGSAAPRAMALLPGLGFAPHAVETQTGTAQAFESQAMYWKTRPQLCQVEVHWTLIDSPLYPASRTDEWWWQTAIPIGDFGAQALGPEAQTLHLCAHLLMHHRGADLLWFNDLALLLRRFQEDLDWELLLRQAQAPGFTLAAQTLLPALAQDWAAPVPDVVLTRLRAMPVSPAEARLAHWRAAPARPPAQRFWADFWLLPGWRKQLAFALASLFPSRAYMRHRYGVRHRLLLPAYYLYRWALGIYQAVTGRS
jgi:hypothetical protein